MRRRGSSAITAAALGLLLGLQGAAVPGLGTLSVYAADVQPTQERIRTVLALVDADLSANAAAAAILLDQLLAEAGTTSVSQPLQSAKILLESGAADPAAVRILLEQALRELDTEEGPGSEENAPKEEADTAGEEQSPDAEAAADDAVAQTEFTEDEAGTEQGQDAETEERDGSGGRDAESEERDGSGGADADAEERDGSGNRDADTREEPETRQREVTEGLPPYEVFRYLMTELNDSVALQVPADWGNSASESELTSYSPANASGAVNAASGTINTSYCVMPAAGHEDSFEEFVMNIEKMSVVSDIEAEEISAADCEARRITYNMNLGTNVFYCETVCMAYEDNLYWVQILQGNKSDYDYFPVFDLVAASLTTDEDAVRAGEEGLLIDYSEGQTETEEGAEVTPETEKETEEVPGEEEPGEASKSMEEDAEEEPGEVSKVTEEDAEEEPGEASEATKEDAEEEPDEASEVTEEDAEEEPGEASEVTEEEAGTGESSEERERQERERQEQERQERERQEQERQEQERQEREAREREMREREEVPDDPIPTGGITEPQTDLASFTYTINGTTYSFPTAVCEVKPGDLPIDRTALLPAAPRGTSEDIDEALGATQFYHYSTDIHMEVVGLTNISGVESEAEAAVITELVDTQGRDLSLELPGNVRIGEPVINLITSFPQFLNVPLDGTASYRDDDTIYAANYREDGCYGYVILKNNAPYYSALSIVCDNGTIREISLECMGAERMARFF